MAKNGKIFFDVNFDKNIIKDYIKTNLKGGEITDENLDIMFRTVINKIVEESVPNLKDLYINKEYQFVQFRIIGHKEEPSDNCINIEMSEENPEEMTITAIK